MEGGHKLQHEMVPEPVPNLVEIYGDRVMTFGGVTDTLNKLVKMCPVPLENIPAETVNTYATNIMNESGVTIREEDQEYMYGILESQGREVKLEVEPRFEDTKPDGTDVGLSGVKPERTQAETAADTNSEGPKPIQPSSVHEAVSSREAVQISETINETPDPARSQEAMESMADEPVQVARTEEVDDDVVLPDISPHTFAEPKASLAPQEAEVTAAEAAAAEVTRTVLADEQPDNVPVFIALPEEQAAASSLATEEMGAAQDFDQEYSAMATKSHEVELSPETAAMNFQEWLADQLQEAQAEFEYSETDSVMADAADDQSPEAEYSAVPLAERLAEAGTVHEAVDRLIAEVEAGAELEPEAMDEEKLIEMLDMLFGEDGYVVIDSSEVNEPEATMEAADTTADLHVQFFETEETTYIDNLSEMVEADVSAETHEDIQPLTAVQAVEMYMQKIIEVEPERFAVSPETEEPHVMPLFQETEQITEAIQWLQAETEDFGIDNTEMIERYEQRLEKVVESLMLELDPDFDTAQVPFIVEELLSRQAPSEDLLTALQLRERATREAWVQAVDGDMPADKTLVFGKIVGGLVLRRAQTAAV